MRILRLVYALVLTCSTFVTFSAAPAPAEAAPPSGVTAIAAGANHTCALRASQVLCWGANDRGQLGDNTTVSRTRPVPVVTLGQVSHVSAGGDHTCALRTGRVWCWGANTHGQLGVTGADRLIPVELDVDDARFVVAGSGFTCVIAGTARAVLCWGLNDHGQLGDGTTTATHVPQSTGLTGVATVALSETSACALAAADGSVSCWGQNNLGQLGDGTTTGSLVPVSNGLTGATLLAGGAYRFCAATSTVMCWGYTGSGVWHLSPTALPAAPGFTGKLDDLDLGSSHGCALRATEVFCWGVTPHGQAGTRARATLAAPTRVPALKGATQLAAGLNHTCALRTRLVLCMGDDSYGQLGRAAATVSLRPVQVLSGASSLERTCAKVRTRHLCWGPNDTGVAAASTWFENTPAAPFGNLSFEKFSVGPNSGCGVSAGALRCWGSWLSMADWSTPVIMPIHTRPSAPGFSTLDIAVGEWHACGIRSDRTVWCGGLNTSGQLGNGTTASTYTSVQAAGVTNASVISAGGGTTCVISAGALRCWGENGHGQLGDGTTTDRSTPALVPGFASGTSHVAVSASHVCATKGGSVFCWGENTSGQLGDGTTTNRTSPVAVPGTTGIVGLALGDAHTCARSGAARQAALWCWGANTHGQLGDGTTTTRTQPTLVGAMSQGVSAVSATSTSTCAIRNASVFCWGDRTRGRLGDGLGTTTAVPVLSLR